MECKHLRIGQYLKYYDDDRIIKLKVIDIDLNRAIAIVTLVYHHFSPYPREIILHLNCSWWDKVSIDYLQIANDEVEEAIDES